MKPDRIGRGRTRPDRVRSIGKVIEELRPEFPEVTISKIRFLESEGLVTPGRSAAGYREFGDAELARLRIVLSAQRDHYLPLKVIKASLDAIDAGDIPPVELAPVIADSSERRARGMSAAALAHEAETDEEFVAQLVEYGLLRPDGDLFDQDSVLIARTAALLDAVGIQPRHLRRMSSEVDREVRLIEALVAPVARRGRPSDTGRAEEASRELGTLTIRLHGALVRARMRSGPAAGS